MLNRLMERLKQHFVPTEENGGNPHLLRLEVVGLVLALVVASQAFLFSGTLRSAVTHSFSYISSNLASVLPSVLAVEANEYRSSNNVAALKQSSLLSEAASMKARDMAERSYFSHNGPGGEKPWTWFRKVGYAYTYAGENLAIDFSESRDVTDAWIKSPTHQANLVNSHFTEIGIGTAEGTFNGKPTTFVVQFFASPASSEESVPVPPRAIAQAPAVAATSSVARKPAVIVVSREPETSTSSASSTVLASDVATSSQIENGEVLGLESQGSTSSMAASTGTPLMMGQTTDIAGLSAGQKLFAGIFLSPRHTLVGILSLLALLFVLVVAISIVHAASRHESPLWADKIGRAFLAHQKLVVRVACLVLVLLGVAAFDIRSAPAPVQISVNWDSSVERN